LDISHLTYSRVAAGHRPKRQTLQSSDRGVDAFLSDHVKALLEMADKPDATPPGRFLSQQATVLFRNLHTGSDDEFVAAAHQLTIRLCARMDGRSADGLLVCLRTKPGPRGSVAGALKLQVDAPNAAILRALDSGEVVLTAVKDMLEKPGDLQKGALVTSWHAEGEVVCGDKLAQAARYFPEAFEIRIFSRPSASTRAFFDAVDMHADKLTGQVAEIWPTLEPGTPRHVLAEIGSKMPEFNSQIQDRIERTLSTAPRPVARLDTQREVTETYKAGDIRVSGPITAMRQLVTVVEPTDRALQPNWQIVVESHDEPKRIHT
jgi:hypothetical protein